eukprot:TRINITY_DN251_c1_g1_i3.p1 TRINITY_DN251_c1_g1~~TRINITY_DN251_c1_g1_i3.p1  ORF type:complete len:109 (-),score=20.88 TRINITY_DN251_c1_g1_i3:254-580(-)
MVGGMGNELGGKQVRELERLEGWGMRWVLGMVGDVDVIDCLSSVLLGRSLVSVLVVLTVFLQEPCVLHQIHPVLPLYPNHVHYVPMDLRVHLELTVVTVEVLEDPLVS